MKRFKLFVGLFVAAVLFSGVCVASSASLTGTWNLSVIGSGGSGSPVFKIKQNGNKLSGNYFGAFGETDIKGKVRGSDFEIKFFSSGIDITYTGTFDGNNMKGSIDFGGQGTGKFTGLKVSEKK